MNEFDAKAFGEKLAKILEQKGIMQMDFAEEVGVHPAIISYWCNGHRKPNLSNLINICVSLNVSADYLLGLCDKSLVKADNLTLAIEECVKNYIKIGG